MNGISLAKALYLDIEENEYLQSLYEKLLKDYVLNIFNFSLSSFDDEITEKEKHDILRFADLLSNSCGVERSEKHHGWAQEIVILLARLFPEDAEVQTYLTSTLNNTGNYESLKVDTVKSIKYQVMDGVANETLKEMYLIPSERDSYFLKPQKTVFDGFGKASFSYSGPTSMGKTFLMRMYIKHLILSKARKNFAVVVPTKALINEVSENIIRDLGENLSANRYRVETVAGSFQNSVDYNYVFVVTPERLLYLLLGNSQLCIDYLFIDEAYEISEKDDRSVFYYKVIELVKSRNEEVSVTFAAPNIPNPEIYLRLISENINAEDYFISEYSPVSQMKIMIDKELNEVSIFNEYASRILKICDFPDIDISLLIRAIGAKGQTIVYCSSRESAVEMALEYKKLVLITHNVELEELSDEIKKYVHEDYYLAELVTYGIAYHIGYLPQAIRKRIEDLYKQGLIQVIFCTSTLLRGVNLPATNLFIMSHKKGNRNLSLVDFKNLIGRVGRLGITLNGNVFLISENNSTSEKFKSLLETPVPKQQLSVTAALSSEEKQYIVQSLYKADLTLDPVSKKFKDYEIARKFALILVKDILDDKYSCVRNEFAPYLSDEITNRIKGIFCNAIDCIDDDINTSPDQVSRLHAAIYNGLSYPQSLSYSSILEFLNQLNEIFLWPLYEPKLVKKAVDDSGHHKALRHYAVVLSMWMNGERLSKIIMNQIKYTRENKGNVEVNGNYESYNGSKEHDNLIIISVLKTVEEVILFKISNYLLRFSTEYKRIHNLPVISNDWYEYVEFGSSDSLELKLQRLGYSRETAKYIKENKAKFFERGKLKINGLITADNVNVRNETGIVKMNNPEAFI